jgi:hypothetical protein
MKANKPLILFKKYSYFFIKNIIYYLKLKWNVNFCVIYNKLK